METAKVRLTITASACRAGLHRAGDSFVVEDLCPPLCHELWNVVYPYVFALQNGASLDCGEDRGRCFDAKCPDGGRVCIHGELLTQSGPCERKQETEHLSKEAAP